MKTAHKYICDAYAARFDCQPFYAAYVAEAGYKSVEEAKAEDDKGVKYIMWISARWRELKGRMRVSDDEHIPQERMLEYLDERLRWAGEDRL